MYVHSSSWKQQQTIWISTLVVVKVGYVSEGRGGSKLRVACRHVRRVFSDFPVVFRSGNLFPSGIYSRVRVVNLDTNRGVLYFPYGGILYRFWIICCPCFPCLIFALFKWYGQRRNAKHNKSKTEWSSPHIIWTHDEEYVECAYKLCGLYGKDKLRGTLKLGQEFTTGITSTSGDIAVWWKHKLMWEMLD